MKRHLIALLLGTTALYPLSALAQGNETQTQMIQPDETAVTISVAQLDERNVTNESGELVGEIEQVMRDEYGSISVVFSHGGYLGIGKKQILVPADWLSLRGNDLVVRLTVEQIAEMEDWEGAPGYEALPLDQNVTISRDRE